MQPTKLDTIKNDECHTLQTVMTSGARTSGCSEGGL